MRRFVARGSSKLMPPVLRSSIVVPGLDVEPHSAPPRGTELWDRAPFIAQVHNVLARLPGNTAALGARIRQPRRGG